MEPHQKVRCVSTAATFDVEPDERVVMVGPGPDVVWTHGPRSQTMIIVTEPRHRPSTLPGLAEYEARVMSQEDSRVQLCDALGLPGLTWDEALAEVRRRGGSGEHG